MSVPDKISSRWRELDRLEDSFLSRIGERDAALNAEVQAVLDRFSRLELNGNLSKGEVRELHRRIAQWKETGMEDIPALRLCLRDMERRSRIRGEDALFLWLFSTYGEYVLWLEKESRELFASVAQAAYDNAAEEARGVTGKYNYRLPGEAELERLLSQPLPNGASFHSGLCMDAEYRARQTARLTAARKAQELPLEVSGPDYRKAERARQGWILRKTDGGHAGFIDLAMTYITGYTVAKAYRDRGVEAYRFVAVLDGRTTEECRALHGKVFRMEELKLGVNAPPIFPPPHPCRSTIRAVASGQKGGILDGERAARNAKKVEKAADNGIIEPSVRMGGNPDLNYVCKIDRSIYRVVTPDITTDEVIITEQQISHIQERHPNDYERFAGYLPRILEAPDYILEANKPNTAFVLKSIEEDGERFQVILRLKTSADPEGYKNSVITFLKVEEKRYNRYLRTKAILYKSE